MYYIRIDNSNLNNVNWFTQYFYFKFIIIPCV